jgi:vacuolar-type H+-ATPase subunit I/STV1
VKDKRKKATTAVLFAWVLPDINHGAILCSRSVGEELSFKHCTEELVCMTKVTCEGDEQIVAFAFRLAW